MKAGHRYLEQYVPLHRAALQGDWEAAKEIIKEDRDLVKALITESKETALHIAAIAEHVFFVEKLVEMMNKDELGIQNKMGNTALSFAAATGNLQIAKLMVEKNDRLPLIRGPEAKPPIYYAALTGHNDMTDYLFGIPAFFESWTREDQIEILNILDVALKIVEGNTTLAVAKDKNGETPLHVLARKPSRFASGRQVRLWGTIINSFKFSYWKGAHNENLMQAKVLKLIECLWGHVIRQEDLEISDITGTIAPLLFVAAKHGNDLFLVELLRFYPDFIREVNNERQSIFHIAIMHRHEHIFNLIYEIGTLKELIATYRDDNDNNMLHLAANRAPPSQLNIVSGAALQMQRQLVWYKVREHWLLSN
ncbi:hypothetical protein F0562_006974 [Nyssa sinensis]|uniref:Uncharacterized protein n=1 Tax=Nyssa sinensis TaxID=561372 RepID=A0A5J5A5R2_9ASTE|nr:hypothetical protein F0562_006974 [Nyssa sinensis]